MRIHWFSPLPPARTDIAGFSARIVPLLVREAEVVLWTDRRRSRPVHPGVEVRFWRRPDDFERACAPEDVVVYNLGNDWRYHARIASLSCRCPGIVIRHDPDLSELVGHMLKHGFLTREEFLAALETAGGAPAVELARGHLARTVTLDRLANEYPLTGWGLENARGVLVHDPGVAARLRASTNRPVLAAELPYLRRDELHPPRQRDPRTIEGRRARLAVFGLRCGRNRRLEPLIDAIASHPQRDAFDLAVVGRIAGRRGLRRQIRRLGMSDRVRLLGYVSETALEELHGRTDLAVNLRYPSRGEASGGLMRVWNHSLPCLVTRTGWYAGLPADCVAHVRPDREREDLHAHLGRFLERPGEYFAMGLRARDRLGKRHTVEAYVTRLLAWIREHGAPHGSS